MFTVNFVKKIVIFALIIFTHRYFIASAFSENAATAQTSNQTTYSITTDDIKEIPIETQRAECTLIAGDVRASAEASVSRKLEGVCATDHLSRALGNLEHRLLNEINQLKAMLNLLLPPLYQQYYFAQPQPQLYRPLPMPVVARETTSKPQQPLSDQFSNLSTTDVSSSSVTDQMQNESPKVVGNDHDALVDSDDKNEIKENPSSTVDRSSPMSMIQTTSSKTAADSIDTSTERILEFRPVQKKLNRMKPPLKKKTVPRDFEIHKFNNTILSGADLRIFTYYWKIEQFSLKLKSNLSYINSPIFSISGLHLRVKATLNHLNRDYLYLQLESVRNDLMKNTSNIILETGDLFKEIQTKVLFKHKIVILDQVTPTCDLISQEFLNTNAGFLVPNSAIRSGPYSKGDSLLIKIVIFL